MRLELKAGEDPSSESMMIDLADISEFESENYDYGLASLTVPQDGVYYLGFHAMNENSEWSILLLDDVEVFEMNEHDIRLMDPSIASDYTITPLAHVQDVVFRTDLINIGYDEVTGVSLDVDVNGGLFTSMSSVGNLLPGQETIVTSTDSFLPDALGTYDALMTASINETDANQANNTGNAQFVVSDSVYARDRGRYTSYVAHNGGGTLGPVLELLAPDVITSVSVFIYYANEGEQFSFSVYDNWIYPEDTIGNLLFLDQVILIVIILQFGTT